MNQEDFTTRTRSDNNPLLLLDLPAALKVQIASYLSPSDVASGLSRTCQELYQDLAFASLPLKIPFKSWYDDDAVEYPKRGPKIPFLHHRTHSVTLAGEWSCRLGDLPGRHATGAFNSQAQFYIMAYHFDPYSTDDLHSSRGNNTKTTNESAAKEKFMSSGSNNKNSSLGGARIVWASRPICQLYQRNHQHQQRNSSWVRLSVTFVPKPNETYYLCIRPGPGNTNNNAIMWRHSLHLSNLIAHIHYHDNPNTDFLLKRQYKTIVKQMVQVENRAAYYTRILEAVARSIRIQLVKLGHHHHHASNMLDPMLESFFRSANIPRDTDSLLVLEEIARFLSEYAYVKERRQFNSNNDSNIKSTSSSHSNSNRDSIPDWVVYAESSVGGGGGGTTTFAHDDDPHSLVVSAARATPRTNDDTLGKVLVAGNPNERNMDGTTVRYSRRRRHPLQRMAKNLRKKIPTWFANHGGNKSKRPAGTNSWRTEDEMTEEFSIPAAAAAAAAAVTVSNTQKES